LSDSAGIVPVGLVDPRRQGCMHSNAAPGKSGLATVNPIFAWVRLAQRVPVRLHLDAVPPDVPLVVGMTATVENSSEIDARDECSCGSQVEQPMIGTSSVRN
jgi:multidrug resistance efflux pump